MKKIYLIDDNKFNQREIYGASFVDNKEYDDCLVHIEKLNGNSDLSFLEDTACVLMHNSLDDYINNRYYESSHKAEDRIEAFVQDHDIPYALFSDGHSDAAELREETPNIIYQINKKVFYSHLRYFLDNFRKTGEVDMRILAFGNDFRKKEIKELAQKILAGIRAASDKDTLSIEMIDKNALKRFIEIANPKVRIDFNELMVQIEDKNVTICHFRKNINNIIISVIKYGKNINTWK